MGANSANDALSTPVQSGSLALDMYLQVDKALKEPQQAKLAVTNFLAQTPPAEVVAATVRLVGSSDKTSDDGPVQVSLAASDLLHIKLSGSRLRPSTTYKGWLFIAAGQQSNRWELTLTTGGRGVLAVDPIGTQKFVTFPPCAWILWLSRLDICGSSMGNFSVTLRDKSEGGPYHRVRVRFEASGAAASKAITSNFSLDTFSFWESTNGKLQRTDLEQRESKIAGSAKPEEARNTVNLDYRGQRTLLAGLAPLGPGEYSGALRFSADESSDDAADAKLPLTIQVRHHWVLPVLVILFGSLVGWFSSKYVVAVRKARELARQIGELRRRSEYLARPTMPRTGWEFSSEATSYGLARVRVILSQVAQLASSGLPILVREEEIQQQRRDAEQRLAALESLHETRLRVQRAADDRPAAQLALGRLLRSATDLLERPAFTQAHQENFTKLLQAAEAWLAAETAEAKYREALVNRRRSQEVPELGLVQVLPEGAPIRQQLLALLDKCPTAEIIASQATVAAKLTEYDQTIAKIVLLWRERDAAWADSLAAKCAEGAPLVALFRVVDLNVWEKLATAEQAGQLQIERDSTIQESVESYDLVEVHLKTNDADLHPARIRYHPLRVGWRIVPSDQNVRRTETDGLDLVQYFPLPGEVKVNAVLRWEGREIPLKKDLSFRVVPNPDYRTRQILSGGFIEWAVIAIAAGFALATAMSTQYDSTFGSFGQYLTLFLWAAGAGTGGNMFKELGTTSAPGGRPEVTLPAAAGGAAGK
jgi:hypothetical protein